MRTGPIVLVLAACGSRDTAPDPAPAPAPRSPPKPAPPRRPRHVADAQGKSPKDPWPAGVFPIEVELPGAIGAGGEIGTAHRVNGSLGDPFHRWALVCQQRRDTDGDGKITYEQEMHFARGDTPSAYFVVGGGPGIELQDVAAVAASGDYLVLAIDGEEILIDIPHLSGTVLPKASDPMFTPDGAYLVYIEGDETGATAIRRTLAMGESERVPLPSGKPGSILPLDARWAVEVPWEEGDKWMSPYYDWCSLGSGYTDNAPANPKKFVWVDFHAHQVSTSAPKAAANHTWCDADDTCHDLATGKQSPAAVPMSRRDDLDGNGPLRWRTDGK
jgi:hypothetical protein